MTSIASKIHIKPLGTSNLNFSLRSSALRLNSLRQPSISIHQHRNFSQSSTNMGSENFFAAVKSRRTIYTLDSKSPISDEKIKQIVDEAVLHAPNSFNSQSSRVVLLLGDEHKKLWTDIVKPAVKAVAPESAWPTTEKKLEGFNNGYGTVLLFEDQTVVKGLQEKFALYSEKFPQWSEHANGILTYILWTALELEGFGANLQHYNPLIDKAIEKQWGVPETWSLKSQLVFGNPTAGPGEKTFQPVEQRVKAFGGSLSK